MAALHLSVLGGFRLSTNGRQAVVLASRKSALLLAIVAAARDWQVSRERLIGLLWSTRSQAQAHASLRQTLYAIRRSLASLGEPLVAGREMVSLRPDRMEADIWQLRGAVGSDDRERLAAAADLYAGPFLDGVAAIDPALDDWLDETRRTLANDAATVLQRLAESHLAAGAADEGARVAYRLVQIDQLSEPSQRLLIRALAATGDRAAAARQYVQCRDLLERELGVTPARETEALFRSIAQSVAASADAPASSPTVSDHPVPPPKLTKGATSLSELPSVAVLPLANLNGDPELNYFSDGLTEDLITALARWRLFPVIASESSSAYREEGVDTLTAGRELGARHLLRGAVRKDGQRIRVTVRLADAATGHHVWAEQYDRVLTDVFAVQDDITRSVAAILVPELEHAEARKLAAKRTDSLTAWQSCLRGRALLNRYTCEGNAAALAAFEWAVAIDPAYSDAWSGIAFCHLRGLEISCGGDRGMATEAAFAAARRAVALDPTSSSAHRCLGQAYVWAEQFDHALAETEAAIELNPNDAHARMALGNRLDLAGRTEEGIAQMNQSLQLNPRDPNRFTFMGYLARANIRVGQYEVALSWATKMVQLKPDYPDARYRLAICLAHLGRDAEARGELDECERLRPGFLRQRAAWRPYPDAAANDRFFAGLRRLESREPPGKGRAGSR